MSEILLINGKKSNHIRPLSFSIFTPGIPIQNAFFETLKFENGRLPFWEDHIKRIKKGFLFYKKELFFDLDDIYNDIIMHTKKESFKFSKVKLVFDLFNNDFYIGIKEYNKSLVEEMQTPLFVSIYKEKYINQINNKIKLGTYIFQNKALTQKPDNCDEYLVVDQKNMLIEGLFSNLLWIIDDVVFYVNGDKCILDGLMQNKVKEICHKTGIKIVSTQGLSINDYRKAEAMLLCNMVKGIRYIEDLNGQKLKRHKIINKLQESLLIALED